MAVETERARGVVDSDEALPLANSEWKRWIKPETNCFALRVESVEIDVRDTSQRGAGSASEELREVFVCEAGFWEESGDRRGEEVWWW